MSAGWVTFTDRNYLELCRVLVRGLLQVSKYPIEVFTFGCTFRSSSNRVIVTPVTEDIRLEKYGVMMLKLIAAERTQLSPCVVIDADIVPNIHADQLIDLALRIGDWKHPICSGHPVDPKNQQSVMDFFHVTSKSMAYVQSNFLSHANLIWFYRALRHMANQIEHSSCAAENQDETLMNVLLWDMRAVVSVETFLPWSGLIDAYFDEDPEGMKFMLKYHRGLPTFHLFHGEKDYHKAGRMLYRLLKQDRDEFIAHPFRGRKPYLKAVTHDHFCHNC